MFFKQFRDGGCLSYLIASEKYKEAIVIDPSHGVEKYLATAEKEAIRIVAIVDTHSHADHLSEADMLASATWAPVYMHENVDSQREVALSSTSQNDIFGIREFVKKNSRVKVDRFLHDGDIIYAGDIKLQVIHTPGHTLDAICLKNNERNILFSGDTLFIGQCGRTDLPGGDPTLLYNSLFQRIVPLKDKLVICPTHDYRGYPNSSLGYEKVNNPALKPRTVEEFAFFVKKYYPPPSPTDTVLQCGTYYEQEERGEERQQAPSVMSKMYDAMEQFLRSSPEDWNIISCKELYDLMEKKNPPLIIDIREPEERVRGYIPGSINIPLRQLPEHADRLPEDKFAPIVIVSQSGYRAGYAVLYLYALGHRNVSNLEYGMTVWANAGFALKLPR